MDETHSDVAPKQTGDGVVFEPAAKTDALNLWDLIGTDAGGDSDDPPGPRSGPRVNYICSECGTITEACGGAARSVTREDIMGRGACCMACSF